MTTFTIKTGHLAGFALEDIKPTAKGALLTKCSLATSDEPRFHIWMRHITESFFSKSPVPVPIIHRFLIILHSDDNADVYVNDFNEVVKVRVVKGAPAGSLLSLNDISDIADITFPNLDIKSDDAIIYGFRTEWRFSLYFDFGRLIDVKTLSQELGTLKREAMFYIDRAELDVKLSPRGLIQSDAIVIPEGKSDVKHLMSAARWLNVPYNMEFLEDEKGRGADALYAMCEHYSLMPQPIPMIFVFDRDREDIVRKLIAMEKERDTHGYQDWGNNVFSLFLPIPPGRSDDSHALSIEFFYIDSDLCKPTNGGRRLFLTSEFHQSSGRHFVEDLHTTRLNALKKNKTGIIDADVFDHNHNNVALPKDDFATAILSDAAFKDVDRSSFALVFNLVEEILKRASKRNVLNDADWRPDRDGNSGVV